MRLIAVVLIAMFMHFDATAQIQPASAPKQMFTYVDQMPEFPGGMDSLRSYISKNIHYPDSAIAHNIEGRVIVKFKVMEDGQIDSTVVLRSVGYGCDEEAIRVMKTMPRWKPGGNNGKPVPVYFTLPFTFALEEPDKSTAGH